MFVFSGRCLTPGGDLGYCRPFCTYGPSDYDNLKVSHADIPEPCGLVLTCCAPRKLTPIATIRDPPEPSEISDKHKLFPSRSFCGYQHTDDRLGTEASTALDEFPWLVQLWVKSSLGGHRGLWAGTLISKRYVLTAATCVFYADM